MPDRRIPWTAPGLLPILFFMTNEGGAEASGGSGMIGKIINFVILFGGLIFVLRKPLRDFLRKRTEGIGTLIKDAREAKLEAQAKLDEAQRKIALLEEDAARLSRDAEAEGLKEKERIQALAAKEEVRLRSFAQQEIDLQLKAAIQELKVYTADLAASLAEVRIRDKITAEEQSDLIDKSIDKLAELYEKSTSS